MENLILFIIGFIYGAGGVIMLAIYKEVREMKMTFEQILAQMNNNREDETNNFM